MIILYKILLDTIAYIFSVFILLKINSVSLTMTFIDLHFPLIISGWVLIIISINIYKGYNRNLVEFSQLSEIISLLKAILLTIFIFLFVSLLLKNKVMEYFSILSIICFTLTLLILAIIFRLLLSDFSKVDNKTENILIIGLGDMGRSFIGSLNKGKIIRFNIVGILDDNIKPGFNYKDHKVLGKIEKLSWTLKEYNIDKVIVAVRYLSEKKICFIQSRASSSFTPVYFLTSIESFINDPVKLKDYAGVQLISNNLKSKSFYHFGKRLIDIFSALFGFVILFPFWFLIPIIIKIDSDGPVFFTHHRVGEKGKLFKMYKFRTMIKNTKKYARCPIDKKDPRITKIGKWLRKTSLDELPQLMNVLKGEMSIVGPRPEMQFIVDNYNLIEKRRLIIKPGLTGLWQISPYRKAEISDNLQYDFYYIENQGYILDLVILFMTVMFIRRGITY